MEPRQPLTAAYPAGEPLTPDLRRPSRRSFWFLGIAVSAAAVVFLGFGRTYYAKSFFGMPALSPLFHIHGALFTAWMLFLMFQSYLVVSRRTALHRKTGWIGAILAVLMLVTGCMVAIAAARGQAPITGAVLRGELKMRVPALDFPPLQAMIIP